MEINYQLALRVSLVWVTLLDNFLCIEFHRLLIIWILYILNNYAYKKIIEIRQLQLYNLLVHILLIFKKLYYTMIEFIRWNIRYFVKLYKICKFNLIKNYYIILMIGKIQYLKWVLKQSNFNKSYSFFWVTLWNKLIPIRITWVLLVR